MLVFLTDPDTIAVIFMGAMLALAGFAVNHEGVPNCDWGRMAFQAAYIGGAWALLIYGAYYLLRRDVAAVSPIEFWVVFIIGALSAPNTVRFIKHAIRRRRHDK